MAVKPICQILGVDHSSQIKRIKSDGILGSVVVTTTTTGADNKQYKMVCLPLKYIFGWIFSIDDSRVNPDAREKLLSYKLEVYDVLFDHFYLRGHLYEKKINLMRKQTGEIEYWENQRAEASRQVSKAKKRYQEIMDTPVGQLELFADRPTE